MKKRLENALILSITWTWTIGAATWGAILSKLADLAGLEEQHNKAQEQEESR